MRIVTQPFPRVHPRDEAGRGACASCTSMDELATKLGFTPNIGAAMIDDDDDAPSMDSGHRRFATTKMNGSLVIAGENGIHWKAIREAAKLVKAVAAKSPHGRGNLNFAATAMVKPYGPFYPGAWHDGPGRTFAVGLESANVVAEVFAQLHEPARRKSNSPRRWPSTCCEAEAVAVRIAAGSGWTYAGHRSDACAAAAMSRSAAPSRTSSARRSARAAR